MVDTPSLQASEDLGAAGATRQRVTLDHMKSRIVEEHTFVMGDALDAMGMGSAGEQIDVLTIYVLVLDNGWVLTGKSAPADPANFDRARGATFAYEDALRQLWPLEGYLLREKLSKEG